MTELKRDYWSKKLNCTTGQVKIDRREIAAIVQIEKHHFMSNLDIHLKSGTIFTVKEGYWDIHTIDHLYLIETPHEEVHIVPNTFTIREGKAPEAEE